MQKERKDTKKICTAVSLYSSQKQPTTAYYLSKLMSVVLKKVIRDFSAHTKQNILNHLWFFITHASSPLQ
jgi:hypothetical protein